MVLIVINTINLFGFSLMTICVLSAACLPFLAYFPDLNQIS